MSFASDVISDANNLVGCRTARLDCKDALVGYYEKKGFTTFNKNSEKNPNRMIRILA
ncbi:MAG: hypothetical protein FWG41_06125 [Methanomassiliicoccaceae archaeon]|nr:hypothetical protein [Methanomassiliicoccaceae archaeon]